LGEDNNIYFAKGQVHQKGKSRSKLATILSATKKRKKKKKNYATNIIIHINLAVQ